MLECHHHERRDSLDMRTQESIKSPANTGCDNKKGGEIHIFIFSPRSYKTPDDLLLQHGHLICIEYHIHFLLLLVRLLHRLVSGFRRDQCLRLAHCE